MGLHQLAGDRAGPKCNLMYFDQQEIILIRLEQPNFYMVEVLTSHAVFITKRDQLNLLT